MLNKNLDKEIDLVIVALRSKEGREEMVNYLKPLVSFVINKYIEDFSKKRSVKLTEDDKKIIDERGWKYLDFALKKYGEKIERMKDSKGKSFNFSSYFTWFIKQDIHEYLLSLKDK